VQTEVGELLCDVVVLATGAAAQNALLGLDWTLPMANNEGIILQTDPLPQVIQHVLMTPDVHFRQNLDGSFVAGEIFNGEINPNVSAIGLASEIISRIQTKLRNVPKLRLAEVKIGIRPVPLDGMPVIGAVPGLVGAYTAIMHSGVTLGPFVGQLLASEILDGYESPLLKLFRPVRFA
jgi:glycine/D-amino acid oxidase-like deaminating enzyme